MINGELSCRERIMYPDRVEDVYLERISQSACMRARNYAPRLRM